MFCINYGLLKEERERLSNIKDINEFETDLDFIVGQIQLICNKSESGFVDTEIPYDGEFVSSWFEDLNKVLIQLKTESFVAMLKPDCADIWLEFETIDKTLLISEICATPEGSIGKTVTNIPNKRTEILWSETISLEEFVKGIFETTDKYIKDIRSLNEILLDSRDMRGLINAFQKAKELWLSDFANDFLS